MNSFTKKILLLLIGQALLLSLTTPVAAALSPNCDANAAEITGAAELTPAIIKEEGDFIHFVWQTTNSYRSRYKPMKDGDGKDAKPITNINAYIAQRNIPPEYRSYYRPNAKGAYEEDIKRIPNQWLAPNNAAENSKGAVDFLANIRALKAHLPRTKTEAVERIIDALRNLHVNWYSRIDWDKSYEPATYDVASIDKKYTGAMQLYKVAERHGLLSDPIWRVAFESVLKDLAAQKLAPVASMDAANAYVTLTHETGTRPAIAADPFLREFFNSKLKTYKFDLHSGKESERAKEFIATQFSRILGIHPEDVVIKAPPVPPGSTARIFLIGDAAAPNSGIVAVMKVQSGNSGLEEIVSTMAAENEIPELAGPVETYASGQLGHEDYFIIQEAAKETEADRAFENPKELPSMVQKVAAALGAFHGRYKTYTPEEMKSNSADFTIFKGNCFYDVRQMKYFFSGEKGDIFTSAKNDGVVSKQTAQSVEATVHRILDDYSKMVELKPELLSPALIHGDWHGGNIFTYKAIAKSKLIDYSGAMWFLGKKGGTGDRGNDVGRMVGNILVEGTRRNFDLKTEILPLIKQLLVQYKNSVGLQPGTEQEHAFNLSVSFYGNRFIAVNAADTMGKKFKPVNGESPRELRKRLYENWYAVLEQMP